MMNDELSFIHHSSFLLHHLLGLLMARVATAAAAELAELQPLRRRLLVLRRHVIATLAFRALKHDVIAWHNSPSAFNNLYAAISTNIRRRAVACYSTISEIVPAPTVRPPSLIAKRKPFSIAIGVINSISIATLSPGITISTPSGNCATPVTSVVRK